ncbi:hypothetical protein MG296_14530 [Flavobacteriaceae bacterium TK19130]|nr:hypothetical protein [Thermobacterium salinum]
MIKHLTIFILSIFSLITSCSILNKEKAYERNELKRNRALIDKCDRDRYSKSTQEISVVDKENYVYYELDSIRIYISYDFVIGFHSNERIESEKKYNELKGKYGQIFSSGLVTGKMFACESNEDCSFYEPEIRVERDGKWIKEELKLYDYSGPVLKILDFQERIELSSEQNRVFEIWATSNKLESGWGGFSIYFLELTNESADPNMGLDKFLDDAELNCFRYAYTQI